MSEKKKDKDWTKWIMRIVILLMISCGLVGGCSMLNKKFGFSDDHPIEEMAEGLIKEQLDLDVDLSPGTPE
jgi:flagellar basal body-associated protein FliL